MRTNAIFLEENYMKDYKPKSMLILEELIEEVISPTIDDRVEKAFRKKKSLEHQ